MQTTRMLTEVVKAYARDYDKIVVMETFDDGDGMPASTEHIAKLTRILRVLDTDARVGKFRDRIIIFGSVARGEIGAYSDIDIMIDLNDQDHGLGFMYHPDIDGIGIFLAIAKHFYGLVDVFVRTKRWMAVRSDDARHWIPAKGSRALWKIARTEGKSLDAVLATWPPKVTDEA